MRSNRSNIKIRRRMILVRIGYEKYEYEMNKRSLKIVKLGDPVRWGQKSSQPFHLPSFDLSSLRPMLRSRKRLTTQTVDPIRQIRMIPGWHLVVSIIYIYIYIARLPDRADRYSPHIGRCSRRGSRWIGGKETRGILGCAAKDERQAEMGWRGEARLDDAYIRLKLIGIVPLADISYLPARGSLR